MKINFTTEKIDRKLYEKSILTYIYDHYYFKDYHKIQIQDLWEINIRTYPIGRYTLCVCTY